MQGVFRSKLLLALSLSGMMTQPLVSHTWPAGHVPAKLTPQVWATQVPFAHAVPSAQQPLRRASEQAH